MGTETMKGSNYAWAIAIACVAFYAIPLGVVANQAGLFASPVMEEFGWSRTDATRIIKNSSRLLVKIATNFIRSSSGTLSSCASSRTLWLNFSQESSRFCV